PLGGGAQLPRARQPAAPAGVGAHAERGARLPAGGLVDLDRTRARHHDDGTGDESPRRRASRRARSAPEGLTLALGGPAVRQVGPPGSATSVDTYHLAGDEFREGGR